MSQPIPISGGHHGRARSASESSESSAGTPPPQTPPRRLNMTLPRVSPSAGGPGTSPTSPILSFLLNGAPTGTVKSPTAYPFVRNPFCGTMEDEDTTEDVPAVKHARRASTAGITAGRFGVPTVSPPSQAGSLQNTQQERGSGVLRRLSLSGAFARPQIAQPAATVKKSTTPPPIMEAGTRTTRDGSPRGQRRRATLGVPAPPPRAPSPMGERILKGHFDGFN